MKVDGEYRFQCRSHAADKALAAAAAVAEVESGMLVGLGTGSTAAHAIRLLTDRVREGLRIDAVATSEGSARLAREGGVTVRDFAAVSHVDLTIDGADRIDPQLHAIKGAGGAMLREKIVAAASRRMIVIADAGKQVAMLGGAPVPVEVLPFGQGFVQAALGPDARLRTTDGKIHFTDSGNIILDWHVDLANPYEVASRLDALPGVLGHGLFLREVDAAYIAGGGIVTRLERGAQAD